MRWIMVCDLFLFFVLFLGEIMKKIDEIDLPTIYLYLQ